MRSDHFRTFSTLAVIALASAALVSSSAAQQRRGLGGGGGPAPHAAAPAAPHISAPAPHFSAPAPHMAAPAPHFAAPAARVAAPHLAAPHFAPPHVASPRFAAPHAAPHVASPRFNPPHIASPRVPSHRGAPSFAHENVAHGHIGRSAPNVARHAAGHAPSVGPAERAGRNRNALAPSGAENGAKARAGNETERLRGRGNTPGTIGQGTAGANRNAANALQAREGNNRNHQFLRNPAISNASSRNPADRALARSAFQGRFARSDLARDFNRGGRHHRHFGFVLGFAGPLFWPYAYDDFIDYTFWPAAYDTFWPYAYDDVFEGIYGAYAPEYGTAYAYAGAPASRVSYGRGAYARATTGSSGTTQICSAQAQGLTNFPIERIAQQVGPDRDQQALLDDLKAATDKAVQIMQAACPNDLPATPTGRLTAMHARVAAMLQAVRTVRPALDRFYAALSDEQKERFNALDQQSFGQNAQPREISQWCGGRQQSLASLPVDRIERTLRLSDTQDADLRAVNDAAAKAADILNSNCPNDQSLTPPGRIAAMEQRLSGMLQAIDTVRPALTKFYGALSDEQKARFDRLNRRRT